MEPQPLPRWKQAILFFLNPKVGIPLALAAALLLSPFIYRAHQLSGLPEPADPFDVAAFGTVELSDADNAFVEYGAAVTLLKPMPTVDSAVFDKAMDEGWLAADETLRQWIADNRPALELWRQGTAKPDALYHQPKDMTFDTQLAITQELRTFARLARLEGSRLEIDGKPAEAWEWYRAIIRSSRHSGRYGSMIERLVGIAMHAIASPAIAGWAANPQVDASLLRQALGDLSDDFELTPAMSVTFKTEYLTAMNSMDHPSVLHDAFRRTGDNEYLGRALLYVRNEPEVSRRVLPLIYANLLSQIDRPRHLRASIRRGSSRIEFFELDPATGASSPLLLPPDDLDSYVNRTLLARSIFTGTRAMDKAVGREEARQRPLVVALACQLYHREHGRFPEKLEDYLTEVPIDPYAPAGEPLRYRRDNDEAIVWSIGENGVDNAGDVERPDAPNNGDVGFRLKPPKTGEP